MYFDVAVDGLGSHQLESNLRTVRRRFSAGNQNTHIVTAIELDNIAVASCLVQGIDKNMRAVKPFECELGRSPSSDILIGLG
jgi:hypothetical protein